MIKNKLAQLIAEVVGEMGFDSVEVGLERPADEGHGAWSTNAAMVLWPVVKETRNKKQETNEDTNSNQQDASKETRYKNQDTYKDTRTQPTRIQTNFNSQDTNKSQDSSLKKINNPRELGEKIAEEIRGRVGLEVGSDSEGQKIPDQVRDDPSASSGQAKSKSESWFIDRVEVAGPGFVNFYLKDNFYLLQLGEVIEGLSGKNSSSTYQVLSIKGTENKNKVIVEYSSPNIAKPFTIGHLRSTIIGDAVANLLEAVGYEVIRDNHLGDWGTQFGKQIYAIKTWGSEEELNKAERPVKKLVELYVKFHEEAEKDPELNDRGREWFKKLEDGDDEARRLWQKCVDWSWKEFDAIYERLSVPTWGKFVNEGRGYGESYFEDKMDVVIEKLDTRLLLKEGEGGAKIVEFDEETKLPPAMIVKSDGATLYHTRDLAADKFRKEKWDPDMVINEVGAEQGLYFRQLYKMEEMLGWFDPGQRVHISHGLYRFAEGKMSTRKGNVIWLEDVLTEAVKRAANVMEEAKKGSELNEEEKQGLAEIVGIGALKWNDLKSDPKRDVVFDWDEILNMAGNSGPYVQYTYARARSVLRKARGILRLSGDSHITRSAQDDKLALKSLASSSNSGEQSPSEDNIAEWEAGGFVEKLKSGEMGIELNEEERAVLRQLARFGEVVERAAEELAPHLVAGYVYELAQRFNTFYNKHSILGDTKNEATNSKSQIPKNTKIQKSKDQKNNDAALDASSYAKASADRSTSLGIADDDNDVRDFRLALTLGMAEVLRSGLGLLGIGVPERM